MSDVREHRGILQSDLAHCLVVHPPQRGVPQVRHLGRQGGVEGDVDEARMATGDAAEGGGVKGQVGGEVGAEGLEAALGVEHAARVRAQQEGQLGLGEAHGALKGRRGDGCGAVVAVLVILVVFRALGVRCISVYLKGIPTPITRHRPTHACSNSHSHFLPLPGSVLVVGSQQEQHPLRHVSRIQGENGGIGAKKSSKVG